MFRGSADSAIAVAGQHLPVKMIVFNKAALSFPGLEMKAAGIVTYGTGLDNPDFAAIACATGLFTTLPVTPTDSVIAGNIPDQCSGCTGGAAVAAGPQARENNQTGRRPSARDHHHALP